MVGRRNDGVKRMKKLLIGLLCLAMLGMFACAGDEISPQYQYAQEETMLQELQRIGPLNLDNFGSNLPLPRLRLNRLGISESSVNGHRRDSWTFHLHGYEIFNDEGFFQFIPMVYTYVIDYDEVAPRPVVIDFNLDGVDDLLFLGSDESRYVFVWDAEQQRFVHHEVLSALDNVWRVCEYTGYLRRRYPNRDEICAGFWICPHAGSGDRSCVMEMFELWTYENEQVQHVGHIRDRATHFAFYVEVAWEGGEWETLQRIIR